MGNGYSEPGQNLIIDLLVFSFCPLCYGIFSVVCVFALVCVVGLSYCVSFLSHELRQQRIERHG